MKRFLPIIALIATPVFAADLTIGIALSETGGKVISQQTTFHGISDAEAAALKANGMKVLDVASKSQGHGGPFTVTWTWGTDPSVETSGLTFSDANRVTRAVLKFSTDIATDSEKHATSGHKRPWGNK